jgi:hypothetical protein
MEELTGIVAKLAFHLGKHILHFDDGQAPADQCMER